MSRIKLQYRMKRTHTCKIQGVTLNSRWAHDNAKRNHNARMKEYKTYQGSVVASECSRQRTRIWLDRSLDCILHSTNIETPCAQLNPRQRGRWNIEFVELNRRTVKKELRSRNHFATKKFMDEEQVGEEEKYWHNAVFR